MNNDTLVKHIKSKFNAKDCPSYREANKAYDDFRFAKERIRRNAIEEARKRAGETPEYNNHVEESVVEVNGFKYKVFKSVSVSVSECLETSSEYKELHQREKDISIRLSQISERRERERDRILTEIHLLGEAPVPTMLQFAIKDLLLGKDLNK